MYEALRLVVRIPGETLLQVSGVAWVQARLADGGGIGIWPGHAPLVGETMVGPLRYADGAGEHSILLDAGVLEIARGQVTIYTTGLVDPQEVAALLGSGAGPRRRRRLAEMLLAGSAADGTSAEGPYDAEKG